MGHAVRRCLVAALAILLAACGRPAVRAVEGPVLVDDAGDSVRVPLAPGRVVSLLPTVTELVFDLGAGERLVGRTAWCDYPAEAARVPSLGDGIAPSVEALLGARPDLVLLYDSPLNAPVVARLRAQGIATLRLRADRLADVPRLARLVGAALGRSAPAESLAAAFGAALDTVRAGVPQGGGVPAFILVWDEPPTTVGQGSFLTELVTLAGGRSVFADVTASSAPVSIEAVAARDPRVVLVAMPGRVPPVASGAWGAVRSLREGRVVRLESSEFLRPTPRAPAAARALARDLRESAR